MLINQLINNDNFQVLKTKVSKCLNMSFDEFIRQYNSHRYSDAHKVAYVEEYNYLLYKLCVDQGVIELSDDTYSNGIKIVKSIDSDMYQYLRDETICHFNRIRKDVSFVVDLKHSVELLQVFTDEYGTVVPVDTYVAINLLRKQIQSAKRGVEWKLTFNELKKLMTKKRCHYSGVELTLSGVHSLTLDRIDSTKGYEVGNTVACSQYINNLKNKLIESKDLTHELTDAELKRTPSSLIELI